MSGLSMMFIGAALMALSYLFVHYRGVSWQRVLVWAVGSGFFIYGTMTTMNDLHFILFRAQS